MEEEQASGTLCGFKLTEKRKCSRRRITLLASDILTKYQNNDNVPLLMAF
jgi:hypothetical protein